MLKPCSETKRRGANYGTGFLFTGFLFANSGSGNPANLAFAALRFVA